MPAGQSELAQQQLKDPYIFDFLTIAEPFRERELETGLLRHLEAFLLELGNGFAFVGRQYPVTVSDQEYYIDLLFYHLTLRAFIVIELKRGDFKPEYAGKMNFYCSVVDEQLRHATDQATIGLILCQTKDRILAKYALRGIQQPIVFQTMSSLAPCQMTCNSACPVSVNWEQNSVMIYLANQKTQTNPELKVWLQTSAEHHNPLNVLVQVI